MGTLKMPRSPRYRKRIGAFGAFDSRRDKSVLRFDVSPLCYNFDMSAGALRDGYGVEKSNVVPETLSRYWVYRFYSESEQSYVEQYVFQMKNGLLRYYSVKEDRYVYISGKQYPQFDVINYKLDSKDILLMSGYGTNLFTWDGARLHEYHDSPKISSMALHYERLFVTSREEPTRVYFSDDLDPTNWTIGADGAGFIELLDERGYLNKVVSFGSYLYIFRDHGISRVTAFGDQREFAVVNLFATAGRIYPSSICTCGSVIMFSASDGLYAFDGYECKRILRNLDGLIKADDDCACAFFDGRYYLACKADFGDGKTIGCETGEYKTNCLAVIDPVSGECSVSRGLNIEFLNACSYGGSDYLMCCDGGKGGIVTKCGARLGISLPKHWESAPSDMSAPEKNKIVRELCVESDKPCDITVASSQKIKTETVRGGSRRLRFNIVGRSFRIAADTSAVGCRIGPPTVIYSVC